MVVGLLKLSTNVSDRKMAEWINEITGSNVSGGLVYRMFAICVQAAADFADARILSRLSSPEFVIPGSFGTDEFSAMIGAFDGTIVRIQKPGPMNQDGEDQRSCFSGKHKCPARTALVAVNAAGRVFAFTDLLQGSAHDMRSLAESGIAERFKYRARGIDRYHPVIADAGFQGIERHIPGSRSQFKNSRNGELTEEQVAFNGELHSRRQIVERFFGRMKTRFPMLGGRVRAKKRTCMLIWRAAVGLTDLHIEYNPLNDDE
jgi:hypothetical protein